MTELDKLLEICFNYSKGISDWEEIEKIKVLKSEINETLNEHHKIFNYQGVIKKLRKEILDLKEKNRQLRFELADEQDCNQHGECYKKIKELKEKLGEKE